MAKITGNTTATPNPRPDWNQTDETKADYIKNKPTVITEDEVVSLVENHSSAQVPSDWNQTDEAEADFIKNKPDIEQIIANQVGGLKFYINENGKLTLSIEEE